MPPAKLLVEADPVRGGRRAVAASAIAPGEVITREWPLCSIADGCAVLACEHCFHACGTLHQQLAHLTGVTSSQWTALPMLPGAVLDDPYAPCLRCPAGCEAVYCSEAFLRAAASAHRLTCISGRSEASRRFMQHGGRTNETVTAATSAEWCG